MKLTLIGLTNYVPDLWNEFSMPTGIDAEDVKNEILLRGGEFELLYATPVMVKHQLKHISRKWARTFEKWNTALNIEYSPLENYDRREESTDTGNTTNHSEGTSIDTSSNTGSNSASTNVSAFNSDTLRPNDTTTGSSTANTSGNTELTNDAEVNTSNTHTARLHGNIGVTTSQQMLQSELDIARWNLIEHIADIYVRELCIPIYE